ncbi:MAG: hypothetical protein WB616_04980 [Candidatus Sulfotelmatobacter sp.]
MRGLVNGIESVEFMIIPGWKVKTTYWMHCGRTCREVSGSSGREASGTVANGSAGVHVRRAARKGDVLVQTDKPRFMVPPIFFSAALAGCRVLRCCAKPGVSTSPGQTAGYADATRFQFVTQAPRQSARPWFPAVP